MTPLLLRIIDLIYPTRCGFCNVIIPFNKDYNLCDACILEMSIIENGCKKCGKTIEHNEKSVCVDCQTLDHQFDRAFSVAKYQGALKRALINYKYHNNQYFIETLGRMLAKKAREIGKIDLLIPVPLHKEKLKLRGFNQAEKIAKVLSRELSIRIDTKSLIRTKNTISQATLSRDNRIENIKNAFSVSDNTKIRNKIILIIDDIYTTGSTASECAKALKNAGSEKVFVLTVASGKGF